MVAGKFRPAQRMIVSGLCLAILLVAANVVIAVVAPVPVDVTTGRSLSLSPLTLKILAGLDGEVTITLLEPTHVRTPDERSFDRAAGMLQDLLVRYQHHTSALTIRRLNAESSTEAATLRKQFPDATTPCVLLTYARADRKTRHEVLQHQDLVEFQGAGDGTVGGIDIFAEQAVTGALARLVSDKPQTIVYCLTGHGELTLEPAAAESRRSMSALCDLLRAVDIETRPLDLTGDAPIPADADVVLIAGPQTALSAAEANKLETYLKHGGSGLMLLDLVQERSDQSVVPTGLDSLLTHFGVLLGSDYVVTQVAGQSPLTSTAALPADEEHRLLRELPRTALNLQRCRSVRLLPGMSQRKSHCLPLLISPPAPRSWAEGNLLSTHTPALDSEQDLAGPVAMGVLVERLDRVTPEPMLVVVGDAEFAANREITGPHQETARQFLINTLSWLAGETDLMSDIPVLRRRRYELPGTAAEHRGMVWMSMLLLSALITTTGATVWTIRRNG